MTGVIASFSTNNGNEGLHTPNGKMHAVCESIITIDEVEPEQVPKEEVKAAFTKFFTKPKRKRIKANTNQKPENR